jgi:hypothetical protein
MVRYLPVHSMWQVVSVFSAPQCFFGLEVLVKRMVSDSRVTPLLQDLQELLFWVYCLHFVKGFSGDLGFPLLVLLFPPFFGLVEVCQRDSQSE